MSSIIRVRRPGRTDTAPAVPTPIPGLVIACIPPDWPIIHVRSGNAIGSYPDLETALAAAADLGRLFDWTRPATDLQTLPRWRQLAIACTGLRWGAIQGHKPGPDALEDLT